ncbi:phage integrase [Streptococcus pneumoniae]|nr:phage integrase [Streptococcus pneumoniae]CAG5335858.1 phage integrase [Streptococcus pneumoniae]
MWMEELPNGKYKFFERYKDPYTEKLKKVSVTMEKKTPQARNQAAILLQEKINKKLSTKQVESITFEEIYNLFYKSWAQTVKESTKHNCKSVDKKMKKSYHPIPYLLILTGVFFKRLLKKLLKATDILQLKKYGIGSEVSLITLFNTLTLKTTRSIILRFLKNQRL